MGWILVIAWMFSNQPSYRTYPTELECQTARIYFTDKIGGGLASCYETGVNELPRWPVEGYEMPQEGRDWLDRNVD